MEYDVNDTSLGLEREHEALTWLRTHDPIHWDAKNEAWLLTRHADVREVLHRPRTWSSAHGLFPPGHLTAAKSSILTMDDPQHARYRRLIAQAFTPAMLQRQASRVRSLMDDAIDAIADRHTCDFVESLAVPLPMRMIAGMLGFDDSNADEFCRLSDAMMEFSSAGPQDVALLQRGVDAFVTFRDRVCRAMVDRRRRPREDLLSILLEGVDAGILRSADDPMEDDVYQFAVLLVVAGNETTRNTISWGMHALLDNPDELALIRSAPGEIPLAVEECIRWASTVRGLKRTALEDTEISGRRIRSGERVILLYPSANRDEAVFERPFEFRATRTPNPHLGFGEGNHFCLGANLARLEVRIALEQILERLPGLRLAPGAKLIAKLTALANGVERMDVVFDIVRPRSGQ